MIQRVLNALEQTLSNQAAKAADKPAVAGAVIDVGRLASTGVGRLKALREGVVHVLALPTSRDIKGLSREVTKLRAELAELDARLDDAAGSDQ